MSGASTDAQVGHRIHACYIHVTMFFFAYNEIYTKTESSPLWTRFYSTINSTSICNNIYNNVMKKLNIERIIVGHTVLKSNENNICDSRILFADCHASNAFNDIRNHKLKKFVIEIINDTIINFIYLL